jgi:hypothetical protein
MSMTKKSEPGKLGQLEGKVKVIFHDNFKITEEEFVSPGRKRRLGIFNGMPGYFMSDDFCITTKDEFDI